MAVTTGKSADIYIATSTGTAMTGEAVTDLTGGVYQITDTAKRAINPNASLTVLDGVSTVAAKNYQVNYGSGKITLTNGYTAGGTITVTGEYLTLAQCAQGYEWTLNTALALEKTQTFGDSWEQNTLVTKSGTVSFQRFFADDYFHANLRSYYVLALYTDVAGADRFLCAAQCNSFGVSAGENEVLKENVSFAVHGGIDWATS